MTALLRYQAANVLRSHRWIFPLIVYVLLLAVAGTDPNPAARSAAELARLEGQALASALDWSAAILVPVIALLTRSMLTAEPGAARACVAVARGPARAQLRRCWSPSPAASCSGWQARATSSLRTATTPRS